MFKTSFETLKEHIRVISEKKLPTYEYDEFLLRSCSKNVLNSVSKLSEIFDYDDFIHNLPFGSEELIRKLPSHEQLLNMAIPKSDMNDRLVMLLEKSRNIVNYIALAPSPKDSDIASTINIILNYSITYKNSIEILRLFLDGYNRMVLENLNELSKKIIVNCIQRIIENIRKMLVSETSIYNLKLTLKIVYYTLSQYKPYYIILRITILTRLKEPTPKTNIDKIFENAFNDDSEEI